MIGLLDPEGVETRVLHDLVDFRGKDVLEIGCGDGRMTWRYAGGIFKKCVNSQAVYPLSEQHGLEAQERR